MISISSPVSGKRRIPLTPLIDVIFILIMFFLLSSTFGVWRPLDVILGGSGSGNEGKASPSAAPDVLIQLRRGQAAYGIELVVNGIPVSFDGLTSELDRLARAGAQDAVLIPPADTDFQQIVHVLDAARASGIENVRLHLGTPF